MTYRVVKIEPCEHPAPCGENGHNYVIGACTGCRADGTRMVDVAVVELDDGRPTGVMTPIVQNPPPTPPQVVIYDGELSVDRRRRWVEVNAAKGPQPLPEFPHVDDEPDEVEP